VRISELVAVNLADLDLAERWLLVRGKGKKERQVPFGAKAAAAIERYLAARQATPLETALFLNHRGGRPDRPRRSRHRQALRHGARR